jgi:hypothetical protein
MLVTKRGRVIGRIQADSEPMRADCGDRTPSAAGAEIIFADRNDG